MTMLVPMDVALRHVREDSSDPTVIAGVEPYLAAAEQVAIDYLGRQVYGSAEDMAEAVLAGDAGPDPMVVDKAVMASVLLILGHLYSNREDSVVGASVTELPLGAKDLLRPKRRQNGL